MPKQLFVCRHATATSPAFGAPDRERQLTAYGKAQAAATGEWLSTRFLEPRLLISSPSLRTRTTSEQIATACRYPLEQIRYEEQLYEAPLPQLLATLAAAPDDAAQVLLVGHNPGVSLLVLHLTGQAGLSFSPGMVVELEVFAGSWQHLTFNCARVAAGFVSEPEMPERAEAQE